MCYTSFTLRFIQHPKNFSLIASFLERKVRSTLSDHAAPCNDVMEHCGLTRVMTHGVFQTVAECVLFYYLTKKNENYKNIVRRNYRRRGRSQVG